MSNKVVVNRCYGGFSLSRKAFLELRKMGNKHALAEPDIGEEWEDGSGPREGGYEAFLREIPRDDPQLVGVVEKMGGDASSDLSNLDVVEIPDGVEWEVEDYDGMEWVAEKHRTW